MAAWRHAAGAWDIAMLTRAERLRIKGQTRLAVGECGGQDAAAEASDRIIRHQSFSDYGNPAMFDKFICIDVAAELDRFSGNPRFAKLLAELAGGVFVPLPEGSGSGRLEVAAGKSAGEFGDVMVALGVALKDGRVDEMEAKRILREILEAIVALAGLAEDVKAETVGGGAGEGPERPDGGLKNGGGAGQPVGARQKPDGGNEKYGGGAGQPVGARQKPDGGNKYGGGAGERPERPDGGAKEKTGAEEEGK